MISDHTNGTPFVFISNGNIFLTEQRIFTVPVNIEGVMGKGLARDVKRLYPDVFEEYHEACRRRRIAVGTPYLFKYLPTRWFLFFPTKRKWRQRSLIEDIKSGLQWIMTYQQDLKIHSLALPALGCGLGGLKWEEVKPLILHELRHFEGVVEIYEPYPPKYAEAAE